MESGHFSHEPLVADRHLAGVSGLREKKYGWSSAQALAR